MAETDTDLLSYRHTLKMVLGNVCIVVCSHVYKIHTCPLKTLWKIFSNIRKKNLWHKKFQSLSIFVSAFTRVHVCVSHKDKHGRLRKGGKCISHVLARPSRTWWNSPPSVPQPSETLPLMSSKPSTEAAKLKRYHWCHQNQAQKRPNSEPDFRITASHSSQPGSPETETDDRTALANRIRLIIF